MKTHISSLMYLNDEKLVSPTANNFSVKHFPDVIKIFKIFPHSTMYTLVPLNKFILCSNIQFSGVNLLDDLLVIISPLCDIEPYF